MIDVVLVVRDEAAYAGALQEAGYAFTHREPEWFEHRMFKDRSRLPRINLHVFPADRATYERAKRELATRTWATVQDYANAKSDVVAEIMGRALADATPSEDLS